MNLRKLSLIGVALFMALPAFANTYYGGFEDLVQGDYDYNDIVFTLSGNGLNLNTTDGKFYNKPTLGTSGTPFWNHASWDGPNMNVGYCVYGGGNCGAGLSANAQYLASGANNANSANNVFFSVDGGGSVSTKVDLKITAANDQLYYYYLANPSVLMSLESNGSNTYSFNASGDFGIAAKNLTSGNTFYSQSALDSLTDAQSHLAFFGDTAAAPEPGAMGLMAGGLMAVGLFFRRRTAKA